uniref:THAP domaincontaining protein 9like [Hydra vulgaris] n=1 Tax=Lepeophtheirus salmonis TaxID=72036 RepID=A0A0K2VI73_LEPSM
MVHGLSGREKANLVRTALSKVYDTDIIIPSITCDGSSCNFTMFNASELFSVQIISGSSSFQS